MEDVREGRPRRRTLLQRGAALLGGALGFGGSASAARAAAEEPPGRTLRLLGRRRPQVPAAGGRGSAPTAPGSASGELFDDEGRSIGAFYAHGLAQPSPVGGLPVAHLLELQTFVLENGTLFGLGAVAGRDGARSCAVLGGTGEFAGAQGSYVERPAEDAGEGGGVEFVVTLKG